MQGKVIIHYVVNLFYFLFVSSWLYYPVQIDSRSVFKPTWKLYLSTDLDEPGILRWTVQYWALSFNLFHSFIIKKPEVLVTLDFRGSASSSFLVLQCASIKPTSTKALSTLVLFQLCACLVGKANPNSCWNSFQRSRWPTVESVYGYCMEQFLIFVWFSFRNGLSFGSAFQMMYWIKIIYANSSWYFTGA